MRSVKNWLRIMIPLVVISILVVLAGCKTTSQTTTTQVTAKVQRGDISLEITAVGNLSYSTEKELSFDTNGTIAEVLVDVGDSVTEDQVLAKLDMTEYQQNITTLESALAARQQALTQSELSLNSAKRQVASKEQAVTLAQRNLDNANYNLTVKERAVQQTQLNIESAELGVEQAQYAFDTNSGGQWASDSLVLKKKQLELTRVGLEDANREVAMAKINIEDAKIDLQNAQLDIEDSKVSVTIAQSKLVSAQQDVENAQTSLDDAKATSPEIKAPFDGLVTAINTPAGSEIYKGGAAVTIVDPDNFEANISVGETDIGNVKLNSDATVEFDAITGLVLPAKVISISPTATTASGVVSYRVQVEIDSSTETIAQMSQQTNATGTTPSGFTPPTGFTQGQMPSGFTPPAGFTQGQMPSGFTPPAGFTPGQVSSGASGQSQTVPPVDIQSIKLRQGLTATVNIVYQQSKNALLVPVQALTTKNNQTTVKVLKNGVITDCYSQAGIPIRSIPRSLKVLLRETR